MIPVSFFVVAHPTPLFYLPIGLLGKELDSSISFEVSEQRVEFLILRTYPFFKIGKKGVIKIIHAKNEYTPANLQIIVEVVSYYPHKHCAGCSCRHNHIFKVRRNFQYMFYSWHDE